MLKSGVVGPEGRPRSSNFNGLAAKWETSFTIENHGTYGESFPLFGGSAHG